MIVMTKPLSAYVTNLQTKITAFILERNANVVSQATVRSNVSTVSA